ncbi:MAG: 4Fe-4S dicluster domain-containing protein [Alphaproteobacteria bacterium]|nr:4Fe-4S dicluster domain-containing protein [Alphaproteobacteria bacterium]
MAGASSRDRAAWTPSPEQAAVWPEVSGNAINGLGEAVFAQPRPVFWRDDGHSIRHTGVLRFFYDRYRRNARIREARKYRERTAGLADSPLAATPAPVPQHGWTAAAKRAALDAGADDAGVCAYSDSWTYADRPRPSGRWTVVMAFAHEYERLNTAPDEDAYIEIMAQYGRAGMAAKRLANWIRERGYPAEPKTGPMTEDVLMIPAAIEAGLGELGKHGSMIHRRFGSNFRLSMVTTDLPLTPDAPDVFGADLFCQSCQVCTRACPPDAIAREKQVVRGTRKWYVDFDKCLPYFVENETCGICLAVCPWSRPGVADNLLAKMARRLPPGREPGAVERSG